MCHAYYSQMTTAFLTFQCTAVHVTYMALKVHLSSGTISLML